DTQLLPIVEHDGSLVGIVEAGDLLHPGPTDHVVKMRELARQDYVLAHPGDLLDGLSRQMILKDVENVIVVEPGDSRKPVGIARANDILQLRRWLVDEESHEAGVSGRRKSAKDGVTRRILRPKETIVPKDDLEGKDNLEEKEDLTVKNGR
ncbi:MAG: hypothetical protein ACRELF_29125, partial [Gemmataceae bacterium]